MSGGLDHRALLRRAAALAYRGCGHVEPNPPVGCLIVDPGGRVIGAGHHRRFGGAHAEVEALEDCRRRGADPAGATVVATLEPCAHHGKTPPCADALIEAGVAEVVIGRRDPSTVAGGGAARLEGAAVRVRVVDDVPECLRLTEPFVRRVRDNRPWVIAKWAQTIDGRIAARTGDSKWISSARSRDEVHRLRGRVDAVLTGIGTVLVDDPMLTARRARPPRRVAARCVLDGRVRTPADARLVATATRIPTALFCAPDAAGSDRAASLSRAGVRVVPLGVRADGRPDPAEALRWMATELGATNVLVEAGPRLLGSLFALDLVDEALVFTAPALLGDPEAAPAVRGPEVRRIADARRLALARLRRVEDDVVALYRC